MKYLTIIALVLLIAFWLLPAYFTLQTSFLSTFTSPFNLWGRAHLENWRALPWHTLGKWWLNSLIVCGATAFLSPLVCISAGYALVRYNFPGKEKIFYLFLLAIAVPGVTLFLPRYLLVAQFHLTNSYFGLFLPVVMMPTYVFLARQYLAQISMEVIEAARLDGASELKILQSIVLPLAQPLVILISISGFLSAYGDFMWQYLVGKDIKTFTVGVGLFLLRNDSAAAMGGPQLLHGRTNITMESLRATVSVLQSLPLIILFAVGQKFFLKGIKI